MIEINNCSDSTVVCKPSGDLDLDSSMQLRHVMSDLYHPGLNLVIDLRHVDMVDAVGVSALVGAVRNVRAGGGTAYVRNLSPRVMWFLKLLDVHSYIDPEPQITTPGVA